MIKKTNKDILKIIEEIQKKIEFKPSLEKMFEEVQMMGFKIRPLQGDLSAINLKDKQFISVLWSLGKLDQYFNEVINKIPTKNHDLFIRLFQELFNKYNQQLNKINLYQDRPIDFSNILEVEIFREKKQKLN